MITNAAAVSLGLSLLVIQVAPPQPRDAKPAVSRAGTATIRGRVYAAEAGSPVRRATVSLMSMAPRPTPAGATGASAPPAAPRTGASAEPGQPRYTITDRDGKFEFTDLPAGSYRIRVQPSPFSSQYLGAAFGVTGAMDPGRPIHLKEGEQFNEANFSLRRGGAIAGRIVDENGEPLSRLMVYPSRVMPGTGTIQRTGGGLIQSDDHGRYRIFGLEPGDYVVAAEARGMGGPPVDGVETEGFATTYHPSAPNEREGARVRVREAADTDGVDIQVIRTRTYRITGVVMDSQGRVVTGQSPMLVKQQQGMGFSTSGGASVDQQGRFTIRDVVPGDYILVLRPGGFGPPTPETPKQPREYAFVSLSVNADIENLAVVTQPGVTIAGHVVFADGPPAAEIGDIRIMTQPANRAMMMGPSPSATAGADLRFTLTDLFGPHLVRVGVRREFALKAIMLGSTDITDMPVEFKREHSGHLQVVISTRPAFVEGTVTGDDGAPVEQAMVLIFPEDKESWKMGSPRVRTATTLQAGKYATPGLIGGRYFAVAVPFRSLMMTPDTPPEVFEALAKDATRFVIADDERRVIDLRVAKRPE